MKSTPYRCPLCAKPTACGYHGQLVFGKEAPPTCKHNEPPGRPCHEGPVKMEPCR